MATADTLDAKFADWLERKCSEDGFTRKGLSEVLGLYDNDQHTINWAGPSL
jgi:hypothetical protein